MSTETSVFAPAELNRCLNCDSFVSAEFRKVFGDSDNVAHACLSCAERHDLHAGAAAKEGQR